MSDEITRESSSVNDVLSTSEQAMADGAARVMADFVRELYAPPSSRNAGAAGAAGPAAAEKSNSPVVAASSTFTAPYEDAMNRRT